MKNEVKSFNIHLFLQAQFLSLVCLDEYNAKCLPGAICRAVHSYTGVT